MPTVEKTTGASVYVRGIGNFTVGDRADVSDEDAAYLCETRGDFERVNAGAGDDPALDELTKAELYERAQARDIEGRSEMDKDDLLAALAED